MLLPHPRRLLLGISLGVVAATILIGALASCNEESDPLGERSNSGSALTGFDRECYRWGQLIGSADALSQQDVRDNYAQWTRDVVPHCRELAASARTACQEMRNLGMSPYSSSDVEAALILAGLYGDDAINVKAAISVWC